jgi:mono/diheme cytochrome c family protein
VRRRLSYDAVEEVDMTTTPSPCLVLLVAGFILAAPTAAGPLAAQEDVSPATPAAQEDVSPTTQAKLGGLTFREYCRSCHGPEATGDGPVAQYLNPKPADLTRIRERNRGEFPADAVYKAISGGKAIKGHGNSEMPVWGDAFRKIRTGQTDEEVKARIAALVLYLESIQVSAAPPQ